MTAKNIFETGKWICCEINLNYGRLVVFILHNSAEIWGFRYGLTLGIGTLKAMASTGVVVLVVCAFKRSICDIPFSTI